jgi:hypothetical protein
LVNPICDDQEDGKPINCGDAFSLIKKYSNIVANGDPMPHLRIKRTSDLEAGILRRIKVRADDLYHAQIGEGNLIQLVERALPFVGGNPGR